MSKAEKEVEEVEEEVESRPARIARVVKCINEHLNLGRSKGTPATDYVITADESNNVFILRRPTGIVGLDLALKGGWPAGGISQIAGPESVGKNALCWQTITETQRIYKKDSCIGWCWTEYPIDKAFGHLFGAVVPMSDYEINLENKARRRASRKELSDLETQRKKEQLGEFLVVDKGTTEQRLEAVVEMVRSNVFQIIIVDSIAAILSKEQEKTDLEDEPQQSSEARLVTRFQQKLWGAYQDPVDGKPNTTTILVINQVRGNRSTAKRKKAWTVGGAYALRHGKLVDLWLKKNEPIAKDSGKTMLGKVVQWTLSKGKAGCHDGPTGTVDYLYDSGFDVYKDLVNVAKDVGIILRGGKYYFIADENGEVIEEKIEGGTAALISRAVLDSEWAEMIYDLIILKEGIICLHRLNS